MDASDCKFVGGPLLAMCLLMNGAATAMEPAQSAAAGQSSPALRLPTFLDQSRLADLQKAWRTRASNAPAPRVETGGAQQGEQQIQKAEAAVSTARAAMKRAEQASENAAAVRRRAEEISRRFSAEGVIAAPTATGATSNTAVSPTGGAGEPPAQVEQAVVSQPHGDRDAVAGSKPFGVGGPVPADAAEAAQNVAIREKSGTAPPARAAVPPNPRRAPKVVASNKVMANTSAPRNTKTPAASLRSDSATERGDSTNTSTMADVFSNFMRAFGWNSQPE